MSTSMADPLDPFMHEAYRMMLTRLLPAAIVAGFIGVYKKDAAQWLEEKVRSIVHPSPRAAVLVQENLLLDQPPCCPKCREAMVRRTARNGPKRDSRFWGCSGFPRCRGTRTFNT